MNSTSHGPGPATADFEAALRDLFAETGLDTRSRFLALEPTDGRVHAFETGPTDGGMPRVVVHGTAGFGGFLAPLVAHFDDTRTVAFDRPGYGLSDPFRYTSDTIRSVLVDAIEGVLDGFGIERADLVGHSMGGHASLLFALERPERVRRIATVGAIPGFPGTRPPYPLRLLTVPLLARVVRRLQKPGAEGVLDIAEIFGERDAIRDHPALIRALAAHEADPKSADAGHSEFNALFSLRGWQTSASLGEDDLRDIRHPTTVIWGERDPLGGPDDVREAVELIPDVRFETVDTGHMPFLSRPSRCAQLIRNDRRRPADAGT